jgi:NAD-dependent SIR2 family protein deacetylase
LPEKNSAPKDILVYSHSMARRQFDHNTDDFINEYLKALLEGNAAIFAGAGLSVSSGFFDWKKLLTPIANKLQLNINEEHDLSALAQFFVDNRGGVRDQLIKILTEEFNKAGIAQNENHEILARLPISIFWTTNYDNLIETSLKANGKLPDVKINHAHLSLNIPKRDAIVYKMHGDISDLANTVWINIMIQWKEFNTKGIKMYRPLIN